MPVLPLAVQCLPYASIRPEALQNNLLTAQNQQLYDVPGRAQSPYQWARLLNNLNTIIHAHYRTLNCHTFTIS
ncbi:MAG: hypothetical protein EOO62_26995 [Hymenobacter sp.]|nr:MAG: hypothetical protein EOO62_26995 [Hymenobacter sp.]